MYKYVTAARIAQENMIDRVIQEQWIIKWNIVGQIEKPSEYCMFHDL